MATARPGRRASGTRPHELREDGEEPITHKNHSFGLLEHAGEVVGRGAACPHAQAPVGGSWLTSILDGRRPSAAGQTIARALVDRRIRLHCEPGRALLDGCGMTLARVEHHKQVAGDWLIGLHNLVMHRRLTFAGGVAVGDIIAFPNTAGYLMHFDESTIDLLRIYIQRPSSGIRRRSRHRAALCEGERGQRHCRLSARRPLAGNRRRAAIRRHGC